MASKETITDVATMVAVSRKAADLLNPYDIPSIMAVLGILVRRGLEAWPEEKREYIFEGFRAHVFGEFDR